VPLFKTGLVLAAQLVMGVAKSPLWIRFQPGTFGQYTVTVFPERVRQSAGAPGVCTT